MKYYLRIVAVNCEQAVEISEAEFKSLTDASNGIRQSASIEEKYNVVVENYVEFERELLNLTLSKVAFQHGWHPYQMTINTINRRVINLLTTTRLYIDQVPHNLNNIFGHSSEQHLKFENATKAEYNSCLGYRVLEALRNYVQHQEFPIHSIAYQNSIEDRKTGQYKKIYIVPQLEVKLLKQGGRFKASVLKELEDLGEELDIRVFVREYVESIGRIQKFVRHILEPHVETWENAVGEAEAKFKATGEENLLGLGIVSEDDVGHLTEELELFVDRNLLERRKWMIERNRGYVRFSMTAISNELES